MPLELRDMRWAVTASRFRSLRQAAQVLNVRESKLIRRLKDLKYWLGVGKIACGEAHFSALASGPNPARYIKAITVDDLMDHT